MKKMILVMLLVVLGLVGMTGLAMAAVTTDSADIMLLVTPVITVDLNVTPTYYNFGFVGVNVTTCSVSALTLINVGTVGITIDKSVWAQDGWRIQYSSSTQDGFDLWAMVDPNQQGQGQYVTSASSFSETVWHAYNALTNVDKSRVDMSPTNTRNLWFRLDMPEYVTETRQQKIQVRLRANQK